MSTEEVTSLPSSNFESQFDASFFYTNEKALIALDDEEILQTLISKYPNLQITNKDVIIKKTLLELLDDKEFMSKTLTKYNLSILDFFKLLYKYYSTIFTPIYIKKIKNALEFNSYVKSKTT